MAVFEHTYKPYAGAFTPAWSRFLIIPRHAYQSIFQSKIFTAFFVTCFVCPLIMAIIIYLHHNVGALTALDLKVNELVAIDSYFFRVFVSIQGVFGFLLTVLIGPALVSRDLANNALPLYLSRPFSRAEYVVGKMAVLMILLSAVTWVPGLLLFLFQSYLAGWGWFAANLRVLVAVLLSSVLWSLLLALLALTLSAWIKWRMAASAALFALFLVPNVFGLMIAEIFRTKWGNIINPAILVQVVADGLFGHFNTLDLDRDLVMPVWGAWPALLVMGALCLLLLTRKVRAYEVIR